jgi:hypothetical protein
MALSSMKQANTHKVMLWLIVKLSILLSFLPRSSSSIFAFSTNIHVGKNPVPIGETDVAAVSRVALSYIAASMITTAMRERCRISTFTRPASE